MALIYVQTFYYLAVLFFDFFTVVNTVLILTNISVGILAKKKNTVLFLIIQSNAKFQVEGFTLFAHKLLSFVRCIDVLTETSTLEKRSLEWLRFFTCYEFLTLLFFLDTSLLFIIYLRYIYLSIIFNNN